MKKDSAQSSRYDFIGEHRGGPLSLNDHRLLMNWARRCSEHVFGQLDVAADFRLIQALKIAKQWEQGLALTGDCMKASVACHAAAREAPDLVSKAFARSVGQGVATAHMADHAMGAALYGLKALNLSGKSVAIERIWQDQQLCMLPAGLAKIVRGTVLVKAGSFKLL